MTLKYILAASAAVLAVPASAQTFVSSLNATPTVLGAVIAGQSYTVSATGTSDLLDSFNGGLGLTFTADGIPTYAFPSPYTGFTPNGSSSDPTSGATCVGGPTLLCGALIGAFVSALGDPIGGYFALGSSYAFTAASDGLLLGLVNDVGAYADNGPESFTVSLVAATPGAVPEPASWAMMIGGFGLVGGALRRRGRTTTRFTYA